MNNTDIFFQLSSAIATVLTAGVAYWLYRLQKNADFESGARIVVLEIKEAEKTIRALLEIRNSAPDVNATIYPEDVVKIVPNKSWNKYSHFFIKKLSNDEYDLINNFYSQCSLLEKYLEKNSQFFWISAEERARLAEIVASKIAHEYSSKDTAPTIEQINAEFVNYEKLFYAMNSLYRPQRTTTSINKLLSSVEFISRTTAWNSLKKLADYKDVLG